MTSYPVKHRISRGFSLRPILRGFLPKLDTVLETFPLQSPPLWDMSVIISQWPPSPPGCWLHFLCHSLQWSFATCTFVVIKPRKAENHDSSLLWKFSHLSFHGFLQTLFLDKSQMESATFFSDQISAKFSKTWFPFQLYLFICSLLLVVVFVAHLLRSFWFYGWLILIARNVLARYYSLLLVLVFGVRSHWYSCCSFWF